MSDVKLVLIDDCLAAVDVHVARAICEEAVLGTLLDGQRTAPRTRGAQSQSDRKCPKESKDIHSMGKDALFVRTPCVRFPISGNRQTCFGVAPEPILFRW